MEGYKLINNELKKFSGSTYVDSELSTVSENPVQNKIITKEINTLKKSVSDGKTLVATAITDKGVDTAADATFAVMAENIGQIETGGGELHGATINVSTSEENPTAITVTLTKDSTTIGQKNFDSNGTCTFTDIQESGDYTITASDETDSNSTTATVTGDNIVNKTVISVTIDFTLDGSTATPLNDVSIWLRTDSTGSSLNAGHTTLAEVIADTTTLSSLMADESAMNYLARSTGFADEACANETFMTYLGASPYVDGTVLNSDLWSDKICDSQYFTKIAYEIIPTMTSNTTPYGVCDGTTYAEGDEYVSNVYKLFDKAFNGDNSTDWSLPGNIRFRVGSYATYKFPDDIKHRVLKVSSKFYKIGNLVCTSFTIKGSNDEGTTWETIGSINNSGGFSNRQLVTVKCNGNKYNMIRFETTTSSYAAQTDEITVFGF